MCPKTSNDSEKMCVNGKKNLLVLEKEDVRNCECFMKQCVTCHMAF